MALVFTISGIKFLILIYHFEQVNSEKNIRRLKRLKQDEESIDKNIQKPVEFKLSKFQSNTHKLIGS